MEDFIGLDVSLKDTAISIRRDGKRIWRGKCPSDPKLIAEVIRIRAPNAKRVVFETGPLSVWFFHALTAEGLAAICIDARHAAKALDMAANKTDANDADGLAQLAEVGFYKEVRVKSFDSMLVRTLVNARTHLIQISTKLSNQIRGLMKPSDWSCPREPAACLTPTSGSLSPPMRAWRRSSCRYWRLGAASAVAPPSWIDN